MKRGHPTERDLVERSVRRYARAQRSYERRHPEIFNPVEQRRLRAALGDAVRLARPAAGGAPAALDLGCGSGNVTGHLIDLGARVTAADVSPEFLAAVQRRFGDRVQLMPLNGLDLASAGDASFDLLTAYSVLHHIPDYLRLVAEMIRVVRPGGIIYLDHEVNDNFWDPDGCVASFRLALERERRARPGAWNPHRHRWQRFLLPSRYVRRFKLAVNPEWYWGVEGDIHVWPEDHIEWSELERGLREGGCEVVRREDYLHFSAEYPEEVYGAYRDSCSDMRLLMARPTPRSPRHGAASRRSGEPAGPS